MDGCNASVPFGGLLLGNGEGYDDEIFTDYRNGASICCIKIWSACDVCFVRARSIQSSAHFSALAASAGDARAQTTMDSETWLNKLSIFRSIFVSSYLLNRNTHITQLIVSIFEVLYTLEFSMVTRQMWI